jgi:hypothetical protein
VPELTESVEEKCKYWEKLPDPIMLMKGIMENCSLQSVLERMEMQLTY